MSELGGLLLDERGKLPVDDATGRWLLVVVIAACACQLVWCKPKQSKSWPGKAMLGATIVACAVLLLDTNRLGADSSWSDMGRLRQSSGSADIVEDLEAEPVSMDRWAVCITGQLSRLELESKLNNLIQPLSEVVDTLDVVLVLDDTRDEYVNHQVSSDSDLAPFGDLEQVFKYLSADTGPNRSISELHVVRKVQPKAPLLNPTYVDRLARSKAYFSHKKLEKRSTVHIRQWYHLSQCMHAMTSIELTNGHEYRAAIRLRDDLRIVKPTNVSLALDSVAPDSVLTLECSKWGGINDKIAVVGRDVMSAYFEVPLMDFYLDPKTSVAKVRNPEQFLKHTILRSKGKLAPLRGMVAVPQVFRNNSLGFCLKFAGDTWSGDLQKDKRCHAHNNSTLHKELKSMACR